MKSHKPTAAPGGHGDISAGSKLLHPLSKATDKESALKPSEPEGCHPSVGGDPGQPVSGSIVGLGEDSPQASALDSRLRGNDTLGDIMTTKDEQHPQGVQQLAGRLRGNDTIAAGVAIAQTTTLKPADPYLTNPFLVGLVPGGKLWPGQQAFLTPPEAGVKLDYRVFQGGIACGKTFAAVVLGIALCRETPGIRGLVTSKTYSKLRDGIIEDYLHHFRSLGWVSGEDYVYKKGERRIIFPKWVNALGQPSQILFRGLPRVEFIPALALGWVHIEELAAFPMPVFNVLHHFLRQPGVNCYRLFATTRPEDLQAKPKHPNSVDTTGWIECQFDVENTRLIESGKVKPLSEKLYKHHSSKRIIASTLENEALSQTFVAKMLQMYYPQTSTDYLVVNPLFVNVLGENRYPHEALAARDRFYEGEYLDLQEAMAEELGYLETSVDSALGEIIFLKSLLELVFQDNLHWNHFAPELSATDRLLSLYRRLYPKESKTAFHKGDKAVYRNKKKC